MHEAAAADELAQKLASAPTRMLTEKLSAVWRDHAIAGQNSVTVLAASAGKAAAAAAGCNAPTLWLFIAGHMRSFAWTQHHFAKLAHASAGACAYVVALVPEELDAPVEAATPGAVGRVDVRGMREAMRQHTGLGADATVVQLMRHSAKTTFAKTDAPPFAYAVVRRSGLISRYPACLPFYWHGVWALASWVSTVHRIRPDPHAVIIRTRPDVLLAQPLQLDALRTYFRDGKHGAHAALGQAVKRPSGSNEAQSDVHAVFSWGSYESDVALPFEIAGSQALPSPSRAAAGRANKLWWQRGFANGWGYGRSADEWTHMPGRFACPLAGYHARWGPCQANISTRWGAAPYEPAALNPSGVDAEASDDGGTLRCIDRCLCADGGTGCERPSCLLTLAESVVVRTVSCNARLAYTANASTVQQGARLPKHAEACVARGALREAAHEAQPLVSARATARPPRSPEDTEALLARPIDPAEGVACYCAARTTPTSALPALGCVLHAPQACLPRHVNKTRPANGTRYGHGFYRCRSRAPLRPGAASIWPEGCEPTYQVVPVSACVHSLAEVAEGSGGAWSSAGGEIP